MYQKRIYIVFFLIFTIHSYNAQSDYDKDQQLIYTYLYSKEFELAKNVIDNRFINTDNNSKKVIGLVYLAYYYELLKDDKRRLESLAKAQEKADETRNPTNLAYVNFGYAMYYMSIDKNEPFLKKINLSIDYFKSHPHENFMLAILYSIKSVYFRKSFSRKKEDLRLWCIKAKKHALLAKNNIQILGMYNNMGTYYMDMYQQSKDRKYLDSANISYANLYKYTQQTENLEAKNRSLLMYYLNYGVLLESLVPDKRESAYKAYQKALTFFEKVKKNKEYISIIYNNIGNYYLYKSNYALAEIYYLKAHQSFIDVEQVNSQIKMTVLDNLSNIYEKQGNLKKALEFAEKSKEYF